MCGKGIGAGPAALQFAGALGGLIGALPPRELFRAANDFLLRQHEDESFATAVHLLVDLDEGGYEITSAGHPPALRYDLPTGEWVIDNARGTALGVLRDPELHRTVGRLFPGEALMFYTDGVVESRGSAPRRRHRLAPAHRPRGRRPGLRRRRTPDHRPGRARRATTGRC